MLVLFLGREHADLEGADTRRKAVALEDVEVGLLVDNFFLIAFGGFLGKECEFTVESFLVDLGKVEANLEYGSDVIWGLDVEAEKRDKAKLQISIQPDEMEAGKVR